MRSSPNGVSKRNTDSSNPNLPLLRQDPGDESGRPSEDTSRAGSFFEQIAEGIQERDRKLLQQELVRYFSFAWAVINCLCAGSITAYSLYGHLFQTRLRYSQYRVNIVSITAELGMYLPVPIFGYLCDRLGPGIPSMLSAVLFGVGYLLAAFAYKSGPPASSGDGNGWPFGVMVLAFAFVGMGTSCMYLSAVTTCAKNFGRGSHKGLALAVPIAAFGLSGMWQSQVGNNFLRERRPDGQKGELDVFRYFLFLGITLLVVGVFGSLALRIVDEAEMIDEAVEQLEQSGILEENEYFHRAASLHGYGTMAVVDLSDSQFSMIRNEAETLKLKAEEEKRKKNWLLNEETRRFLSDHTMWWLAGGFFLVTGPGEAFINNLGTIIGTLSPPTTVGNAITTSPATHVSIVAITSTIARLFTGTFSDLLAPKPVPHQHRRAEASIASSIESLRPTQRFSLSRIIFLLSFAILLATGQILLASGLIQNHASRFAWVSSFIGAGYGAVFSLVPIVISVVWGVENFGTNWGIVAMMPAAGAAVWGAIYAANYQNAAEEKGPDAPDLCYGTQCYASTFWAMAASVLIACALWAWAWRGPGGWLKRGVAV
jgi:MFS family permease